jgi:cob(I)alamin adenosyltransferase
VARSTASHEDLHANGGCRHHRSLRRRPRAQGFRSGGGFGGRGRTERSPRLEAIQNDLFALGAELATVPGHEARLGVPRIATTDITRLEDWIDELDLTLPELKNFILPGGCDAGAKLHEARTTCRRAERRVVSAGREAPVSSEIVVYLNRLSDLLFVLARYVNHRAGFSEITWNPRGADNAKSR